MSKYQDVLDYLFNQFPQYQKVGKKAYKADLTNITSLCNLIGNPQKNLKCVHLAGTNGKGSTAHMLAAILQQAKYKVGIFTSPHLTDFRERIKINGVLIPKKTVIEFVNNYKAAFEKEKPSFFEWTTALTFYYFKQQKVDIAIIETGLGGRLDSTNIISPLLSIITTIDKDHQHILGDTIEEIAFEKAGIIKENIPVVLGQQINSKALNEITKVAENKNSRVYVADRSNLKSDLKGSYQQYNCDIACKAISLLKNQFKITAHDLKAGLLSVSKSTQLRGRWEIINKEPLVIADIGHNLQAFKMIADELKTHSNKNIFFILGISDDKNIAQMLSVLPKDINYIVTQPSTARAISTNELKNKMKNFNSVLEIQGSNNAFISAKELANSDDLIFIGGSAFLVAEILQDFFPS